MTYERWTDNNSPKSGTTNLLLTATMLSRITNILYLYQKSIKSSKCEPFNLSEKGSNQASFFEKKKKTV